MKRRPSVPTFAEALETVIRIHESGWKNGGKTAAHWQASLGAYALPRLGRRLVCDVDTVDVMSVLLPIWTTKAETARRVRQRIGAVMKWAIAQGFRQDNPAGEAIGAALPKTNGVRRHLRALPHSEVAAAIATIRGTDAYRATVLAFEFLVLTATRSGEVRLARWTEMDLEAATWTIPGERMKMKREHRVPLSSRALGVLTEAHQLQQGTGLVFPSVTGRPLTDSTISKLVRENGIKAVPHGFRSSFRDWCGETGQPREVAEACLAHSINSRVEAAYARSAAVLKIGGLTKVLGASRTVALGMDCLCEASQAARNRQQRLEGRLRGAGVGGRACRRAALAWACAGARQRPDGRHRAS